MSTFSPRTPMARLVDQFTGCPEHMAVVCDDVAALDAALQTPDGGVNVRHIAHTPLTLAICLRRTRVVEHLIALGADANLRAQFGIAPAALAAGCGNAEIMTLLIHSGVDVTTPDDDGFSLCHYAAANADSAVLGVLIAAGLPFDEPANDDERPVHKAAKNENEQVMAMLIAAGCTLSMPVLHHAAANPNIKVLAMLIAAVDAAEVTSCSCDTLRLQPIHFAATNSNPAALRLLIDAGADPNAAQHDGATPLFYACSNPNDEVLDALLAADAQWRDIVGDTTLCHIAATNRNERIMRRVLEHTTNVDVRNSRGLTPLLLAAESGTAHVVSLLLAAGADVGAIDNTNKTMCLRACDNHNAGVMRVLVEAGAIVGEPVFKAAIEKSNLDAIRALVEIGALNVEREFSKTPMLMTAAARQRNPALLEFLIRQGANFRVVDSVGRPLHHFGTSSEYISVLFAHGANLSGCAQTTLQGDPLFTLLALGLYPSGQIHQLISADQRRFLAAVGHPGVPVDSVPHRHVMWACHRIAVRQFELLRLRAFQVCVGLADAQFPALVQCEILTHAFAPLESLVPFHRVWAIVTKIKHFPAFNHH